MMSNLEPMKGAGFFLRNAKNIVFNNVKIYNAVGEVIDQDDTVELSIL
jgi:hypothetical protein